MRLSGTFGFISSLLAGTALSACGPAVQMQPACADATALSGLSVTITPLPLAVPDSKLTVASMRLDHLDVIGDVGPPPPHGGPYDGGPPMPSGVAFDVIGKAISEDFSQLPQGIYSVVRFSVESVELRGTWRGTPLAAHVAMFRGPMMVDLHSPGREFGPCEGVSFAVTVDPSRWFANDLLDGAIVNGGMIVVDQNNNRPLADVLSLRIGNSFSL